MSTDSLDKQHEEQQVNATMVTAIDRKKVTRVFLSQRLRYPFIKGRIGELEPNVYFSYTDHPLDINGTAMTVHFTNFIKNKGRSTCSVLWIESLERKGNSFLFKARGAFIGLTLRHGRDHMTRAVLEGVAFGLKDSFTLIKNAGLGEISQIRASGGGTKSALWRQILASVLEGELITVNTTEGAAYGAALLAGVGAGNWADMASACRASVKISGSTRPDTMQMDMYSGTYVLFRELYPDLKERFGKMC